MTILGKRWIFGIKQFKRIIIIGSQKVKILSTQNGVKIGEFPISEIGLMKECSRIRSKFVFEPKFFLAIKISGFFEPFFVRPATSFRAKIPVNFGREFFSS